MTARRYNSAFVISIGLLATTSNIHFLSHAQAAEAQTGWAINRVASASAGSYCTMAQRYSDSSVFTLAKNPGGEYSLAFDFSKPVFKEGQKANVTLKPASGAAQKFDVQPQTDKVAVIGLGGDDSLIKTLRSSGKLDVEIEGQTFGFNTAKFSPGIDELTNCVTSIKTTPVGISSTGIASAAPTAVANLSRERSNNKIEPPTPEKAAPVALEPSPIASSAAPTRVADNDLIDLQEENALLKTALTDARKSYEQISAQGAATSELQEKLQLLEKENASLKSQPPAPAPVDEKSIQEAARLSQELTKARNDLSAAQAQSQKQIQTLQSQLAQAASTQQTAATAAQQASALQKENSDLKLQLTQAMQQQQTAVATASSQAATLQKENSDLKLQLTQANQQQQTAATSAQQMAGLQKENSDLKLQLTQANQQQQTAATAAQQMASLQKENADLKVQLSTASKSVSDLQANLVAANNKPVPVSVPQIDPVLQAENNTLKQNIAKLQEQVNAAQAEIQTAKAVPGVTPEQQQRLALLEKENIALRQDLAKADQDLQTSKTVNTNANQTTDNQVLRDLKNQLELAQTENNTLKRQLDETQNSQASNLKQSGNNWDLEQATRRYQEAQREIRRLGALIDQQQKKSEQEKKEIESMLFDPAVASSAQVAMYNSLETRVVDLEQQLKFSGIEPAPSKVSIDTAELKSLQQVPQSAVAPASGSAYDNTTEVAAVDEEALFDDGSLPVPAKGTIKTDKVENDELAEIARQRQHLTEQKKELSAQKEALLAEQKNTSKSETAIAEKVIAKIEPKKAENKNFKDQQDFTGILKLAGINAQNGVELMGGPSNVENYQAFRWKTDNLFGSAEQRALKNQNEFAPAINQYLARAKTRCGGDYAAVPAQVVSGEGYEIACIGGKTNTSASVLFTYQNDVMTTIAHEGKAEAMDQAIEARDRVAAQISSVKTASR